MKLTLVGAGPGDIELVTLKAIRILKEADVVLYDALASKEILDYCRHSCQLIFVGKRFKCHSKTQLEINQLIVEFALAGNNVVRLKGGDPFVFGRAHEEIEYAESFAIPTEVVSGISSSYAVPASCGIPLTMRGVSDSFWVLTGHTHNGGLAKDFHLAAQSSATIVVLMGMSNLHLIADLFIKNRKGNVPICIIQNGTRANQKVVYSTVFEVMAKVKDTQIGNPAVIVIGEVVNQSPERIKAFVSQNVNTMYEKV